MFKMVTYSAALEEGIEHPDDMIDCQGGMIVVNGLRIHDLHRVGNGFDCRSFGEIERRGRGEGRAEARRRAAL